MALPAGSREKRHGRKPARPTVADHDDGEDESGEGEDNSIRVSPDEFMSLATSTIGRADNTQAVARLMSERTEARRKKNYWKQKYQEAIDEQPEGSIVLVDKEAEAIEKLRSRNVDLSKLDELVSKFENDNATLTVENIRFKSRKLFDEYATTTGWNADAIEGAVDKERLHAEMGDVKVEKTDAAGKKSTETVKKLMVRKAVDPKAALIPFDEHIDKNANWMWPSIKAKPANTHEGRQQQNQPVFSESGPAPTQQSGEGSMVGRFIQNANLSNNPNTRPIDQGAQRQPQGPAGRHPVNGAR